MGPVIVYRLARARCSEDSAQSPPNRTGAQTELPRIKCVTSTIILYKPAPSEGSSDPMLQKRICDDHLAAGRLNFMFPAAAAVDLSSRLLIPAVVLQHLCLSEPTALSRFEDQHLLRIDEADVSRVVFARFQPVDLRAVAKHGRSWRLCSKHAEIEHVALCPQ